MPRRKLARRFEPRYGVSQSTIDVETTYVAREVEDWLLLSTGELEQKLAKNRKAVDELQQEVSLLLDGLPERHQLVVRNMLHRDVYHIAVLYRTFMRTDPVSQLMSTPSVPSEAVEPMPLPFREFLFGD